MKFSHALICALAISMALPNCSNAIGVRWHATQLGRKVGKAVRFGFALPLLKIKAGLLLAPIAVPIAIGKFLFITHIDPLLTYFLSMTSGAKAAAVGTIAGTSAVGAAIGAPVGAIMGAKAGALAGAAAGTALVAAKAALIKKALAVKLALIAKPIIFAAGIKGVIASKKIALASRGLALAGQGVMLKGRALTAGAAKLAAINARILGIGAAAKAKIVGALTLPHLSLFKRPVYHKKYYGPSYGNLQYALNTPITGYKYGHASLVGNRKKRESEVEDEVEEQPMPAVNELMSFVHSRNAQQCLAKVICELSADPNLHGSEGVKFGSALLTMSETRHPRAAQFREASSVGTQSRSPSLCLRQFTGCTTPSKEVVRIGNALLQG